MPRRLHNLGMQAIDNPLVRIHFIIVMIRRTGLAPWEFEFPFPGSLTSTFLRRLHNLGLQAWRPEPHWTPICDEFVKVCCRPNLACHIRQS